MDRLDLQHQLWLYTLRNELFTAPIQSPKNILDIGTGTGIWAIEVGMSNRVYKRSLEWSLAYSIQRTNIRPRVSPAPTSVPYNHHCKLSPIISILN